jgi:uncharacterized protein (DUF2384 family)
MENEARASLRTRVSLEIIFVVMIGEKKQEKKVRCFSLTTMKRNVRVTWDGGHFGKKKSDHVQRIAKIWKFRGVDCKN